MIDIFFEFHPLFFNMGKIACSGGGLNTEVYACYSEQQGHGLCMASSVTSRSHRPDISSASRMFSWMSKDAELTVKLRCMTLYDAEFTVRIFWRVEDAEEVLGCPKFVFQTKVVCVFMSFDLY